MENIAANEHVSQAIDYLRHQTQLVNYLYISAITIFLWDYLLTLRLEITLLWRSPWSYTKVVALFVRYIPMLLVWAMIYNQFAPNLSPETCHWSYPILSWSIWATIVSAETVLLIRTWAVWRLDRKVGIALGTMLVVTLIPAFYSGFKEQKSTKFGSYPYSSFRGCYVFNSSEYIAIEFITLTILETFVLTLMMISAYRTHQAGHESDFITVIHRDGITYYIYLLLSSIGNTVVNVVLPPDLHGMLCPIQAILYSVLTLRMIFNIRLTARRRKANTTSELHHYSEFYELPMAFATAEHVSIDLDDDDD